MPARLIQVEKLCLYTARWGATSPGATELEHTRISEQDIETAWSKEIERRLAEIDADSVELISWEEVRAELIRDE